MKRHYQIPTTQVVRIQQHACLLQTSATKDNYGDPVNQDWGNP